MKARAWRRRLLAQQQLVLALTGLGLGGEPVEHEAPLRAETTGDERQVVRHLLQDVAGGSTGPRARDAIEVGAGRRAFVVLLAGQELTRLRAHLERRLGSAASG